MENLLLDYDVEDFDLNITRLECKDAKNLLQVLTSLNLNITRLECKGNSTKAKTLFIFI